MNLRLLFVIASVCLFGTHVNPLFAQVFGTDPATGRSAILNRIQANGETTVIVKLGDPATPLLGRAHQDRIKALQDQVLSHLGLRVRVHRRYKYLPYLALFVDAQGVDAVASAPGVQLVQPDLFGRPMAAEPEVMEALAATPTDESRSIIGAGTAISNGCDGSGWTVAVLDTGIDLDHEAFVPGRIVGEACFSTNATGQTSMCPGGVTESTAAGSGDDCAGDAILFCPHGTLIGGVIAGDNSGSTQILGAFPNLTMISIRVFTQHAAPCFGSSPKPCAFANASDIMAGLEHVADLASSQSIGAVVMTIDMSFDPLYNVEGSVCDAKPAFSGIKDAVDLVNSYGIPVVGGTGNRSTNGISPPVCLSNVISVGNTGDGSGSVAQDVPTGDSNWASFMDFWAPGNLITTAWPPNTTLDVSGTSVSSPHVAATYAALRSKAPTSGIDYFTGLLESSASVHPTKGIVTKPRIDAGAACVATTALGDVTQDGNVFLDDATLAAQAWAGLAVLSGVQQVAADVNNNAIVFLDDATEIAQFWAGLASCFSGDPSCP